MWEFFELLLSACGIYFRHIHPCGFEAPYPLLAGCRPVTGSLDAVSIVNRSVAKVNTSNDLPTTTSGGNCTQVKDVGLATRHDSFMTGFQGGALST
jgi:hypothetical protein